MFLRRFDVLGAFSDDSDVMMISVRGTLRLIACILITIPLNQPKLEFHSVNCLTSQLVW